tara:strand:+ start:677 stop:841 length:165 start_codon:yes stop_codon:yes gene_type:complete
MDIDDDDKLHAEEGCADTDWNERWFSQVSAFENILSTPYTAANKETSRYRLIQK